ncbi:MAG: putative cytochrome c oxidase, CbaD subunit [Proteobacteria bacterium]|nr:putative cytochrome c oxidase, CbaD subunit [Pseudomonadota bacterium]
MSSEHPAEAGEGGSPIGTWVLLCLVAIGMTAAWLFLYFGVFLPRGSVG